MATLLGSCRQDHRGHLSYDSKTIPWVDAEVPCWLHYKPAQSLFDMCAPTFIVPFSSYDKGMATWQHITHSREEGVMFSGALTFVLVYILQLVAKIYNINPHPHWEIFLGLLCFLFSLHIYW